MHLISPSGKLKDQKAVLKARAEKQSMVPFVLLPLGHDFPLTRKLFQTTGKESHPGLTQYSEVLLGSLWPK